MLDVRDVRDLKLKARELRDKQDLDGAAKLLEEAIRLLSDEASQRGGLEAGANGNEVSMGVREIAIQLADCWGSLGGIRRRQGRIEEAIAAYQQGRSLEANKFLRISNTYNHLQWIIACILADAQKLRSRQLDADLEGVKDTLWNQVYANRVQDPWAYADLGLVQLLLGDDELAKISGKNLPCMLQGTPRLPKGVHSAASEGRESKSEPKLVTFLVTSGCF